MKIFLSIIFIFAINISYSQENINSILDLTLSYRGLEKEDITIPVNFDKDKTPTNNSKLLLPLVRELMTEPLTSLEFAGTAGDLSSLDLRELFYELVKIKDTGFKTEKIQELDLNIKKPDDLYNELIKFCLEKFNQSKNTAKKFSQSERDFISKNLFSIISESESSSSDKSDEENNSDIFKFNASRDSSIAVSKTTLDILSSKYSEDIISEGILDMNFCASIFEMILTNGIILKNADTEFINDENVSGEFIFYYNENNIRIAVGGKGRNIYNSHFDFIIDTGGDDVYNVIKSGSKNLFTNNFSCIIDISGNDLYSSEENFTLAGSSFSSGFIFDADGDDTYRGKNTSLGSALFGTGILWDLKGNDIYQADKFSTGAAAFGYGILSDTEGNDVYIANSYSQGFGMTRGIGVISDRKGNDSYLIDARSLDIGRYEDHYVSMSQGYGLGLRPYYAGGIGMIIEGEGNDIYNTDIFGQGGAYWYGLGIISDNSGNDKYNSYQYAQGSGIHLAVGILYDKSGWDFYSSNGVSQGCGHDFGFGLMYDENGNDNYSAYSLSQGAGNANGIGIFIDVKGRDGYLSKESGNTRGYGNSRREFGSLGIFIDGSGEDFYSERTDSIIINSSHWGVMFDFYQTDQSFTPSGSNYKVPLDSVKKYSEEEYFIMAKTIEPRFSLWQEYGFRKLVEDSINTSEYILKYLETDDHRSGLVLRNLAFKIGYSMGNLFSQKLKLYNISMQPSSIFNENEVAYICYLFGETGNPAGKEELLNLTYSDNIRIRTVSVNALGKIKTDTTDTIFKEKVLQRLSELVSENTGSKIFQKDLAFAFKNYKAVSNIPVLMKLLNSNYFGARFLAAEELSSYGNEYYESVTNQTADEFSQDRAGFHSLLTSVRNMPDDKFEAFINYSSGLGIFYDDGIQIYLIEILNKKIAESDNEGFKLRMGEIAEGFQKNFPVKVK
ncbi:MAG: hypothetical protein IPM38_09285 [Ignavibacteria bacterium]|nr:hypothetical protein [Ignavibacteria bacterium]